MAGRRDATVYPRAASVATAGSPIGGCDVLELAREFGTPAYVVAEDDLRARAREFVRALGAHHGARRGCCSPPRRSPAPRCCGSSPRRGWASTSPPAGSCTWRCAPASTRRGSTCTATRSREAELRGGRARGRARSTTSTRSTGSRLARRPAAAVLLRVTPGVHTDTHAAIATGHADQKFGSRSPRRRRRRAPRRRELGRRRGVHTHIGSQLFDLAPYREAVAAIAELGPIPGLRPRRRARRRPTRPRTGRRRSTSGSRP